VGERSIKKVPLLRGRTVVNLFFEPSTRTRSTFELAAKRLSADVLNLDIGTSATSKGETLSDTLLNLRAMASDMFVIRHARSGAPYFIARSVTPDVAIINAGDGQHAHPTQAMLDMLTIRQHKQTFAGLRAWPLSVTSSIHGWPGPRSERSIHWVSTRCAWWLPIPCCPIDPRFWERESFRVWKKA